MSGERLRTTPGYAGSVGAVDGALLDAIGALRWDPLTPAFVLLSAWWVKGVLIAAIGGAADAARRTFPLSAIVAGCAAAAASLLATVLKWVVDRPRPHDGSLVELPSSSSFPSGHAATAFAAAAAVGSLHPRLRIPVFALAALVALSRLYLGVHYPLDVAAGAALGLGTAWLLTRASARAARALARSAA